MNTQHSQTIASEATRSLCLRGLQNSRIRFSRRNRRRTKRIMAINEFILGFTPTGGGHIGVYTLQEDTNGIYNNLLQVPLTTGSTDGASDIISSVNSAITSYIFANFGFNPDSITWLTIPSVAYRTFNNPSLAVNTARQASTTQDALVSASVPITATLSLTTGQQGTVTLQYADNSAFTTNVVSVQPSSNGNTGSLAIGLNLGQVVTATMTGVIPAGKYYRLLTTNVTGTPTYGTPVIQEVLL